LEGFFEGLIGDDSGLIRLSDATRDKAFRELKKTNKIQTNAKSVPLEMGEQIAKLSFLLVFFFLFFLKKFRTLAWLLKRSGKRKYSGNMVESVRKTRGKMAPSLTNSKQFRTPSFFSPQNLSERKKKNLSGNFKSKVCDYRDTKICPEI